MLRWVSVLAVAAVVAGAAAAPGDARLRVVGLQVALRAHGLYPGPIDGVYGPMSALALRRFQRRAGLHVDGKVGPVTRRALGPLGRPSLGSRTISRGALGWDVSLTQFLLARSGARSLPINGYFGPRTERRLRAFQRAHGLEVDGVAGPRTLATLLARRSARKVVRQSTAVGTVRSLLDHWADRYAVDRSLVRGLAWMESGYQPNALSPAGAWGVMQILPSTWTYVETILLRERVPRTTSGNIRVGVALLRELLRQFNGDEAKALAGWYQGPASVRRHGPFRMTRRFVTDVIALEQRTV